MKPETKKKIYDNYMKVDWWLQCNWRKILFWLIVAWFTIGAFTSDSHYDSDPYAEFYYENYPD